MSDKYEIASEAYDSHRERVKSLRRIANEKAASEYDKRIAEMKKEQRKLAKTIFDNSVYAEKVSLADLFVRLLNEGMTKTELLRAIRSNTWSRCVEMLSYASATVEQKERAPVRPAVGVEWLAGADPRVVTIYPNWKSKKVLEGHLVPESGLRYTQSTADGEPVPDYPFTLDGIAPNAEYTVASKFYKANLWLVRELFDWSHD